MRIKPFFLFVVASLLLISVWFRGGSVLGAGETGLPFYNLKQTTNLIIGAWNESGVGIQTGPVVATLVTYYPLSLLQQLGLPNYFVQALLFFLLLLFQLYFAYKLSRHLGKGMDNRIAILASFFYVFNPISIVLVWHRFLLNHIFFYSLLPFATYVWFLALEKKDLRYVLVLVLVATLFSFGLFAPAQLLLFWGFMFLLTAAVAIRDGGFKVKFSFYLLFLFLWSISNSWWILQFYAFLKSSSFEAAKITTFSSGGNLLTLEELSKQLGRFTHLFNFRHGNFFVDAADAPRFWSRIYYLPPVLILQWLFTIGLFFLIYKTAKTRSTRIFGSLLLFFLFLAKGTGPPFGELFRAVFVNFSILEAFRNPFEKFGQLFPVLTLLVALPALPRFGQALKGKLLFGFLAFYILIVWGFPFWTGLIFTGGRSPTNNINVGYQVQVPGYLKNLNAYLEKENREGYRLISLPIGGEGIFYEWPKGYIGVEPSYFIITTPNISYSTSVPYFDVISRALESPFLSNDAFYQIASRLNVRYLTVKKDVDENRSGMRNENVVKERLEELSQKEGSYFKKVQELEDIDLYELEKTKILPKLYLTSSLIEVDSGVAIADILLTDAGEKDVLVASKERAPDSLIRQTLVRNKASFLIDDPPYHKEVYNQLNFAAAGTSPSSLKYPLVLLKEKLMLWKARDQEEKTYLHLIQMGKRLSEVRNALDKSQIKDAEQALQRYQRSIPDLFKAIELSTQLRREVGEQVWHHAELSTYFRSHITFLKGLKRVSGLSPLVDEIERNVMQKTVDLAILPKFDPIDTEELPLAYRQVFRFEIKQAGEYELIVPERYWSEHFNSFEKDVLALQLDNQVLTTPVRSTKRGLTLGIVRLDAGVHEIGIELEERENLVEAEDRVILSSATEKNHIVLPINNYDPEAEYVVSFDYWIREGKGVSFNFNLDNDLTRDGERISFQSKFFGPDLYKFDFRSFAKVYNPRASSSYGEISFSVKPLNECENQDFFRINKRFCADQELLKIFDRTTTVELKDIKVLRRRVGDLVLVSPAKEIQEEKSVINFRKISNERYEANVSVERAPTLLVFSEAFNSEWKAYLDGDEAISDSKHVLVNAFANGWILDKTGKYKVLIEFAPVDLIPVGKWLSILSSLGYLFVLGGVALWRRKRN